jgi:cytoskeleton protein RodZ
MKRLTRPEPSAGEAARLGEELRDARLTLGMSIEDIAGQLRIRRVYLVALEEGRTRDLPAPAYAVGFIRSYAKLLGLDENEFVRRFRDASGPAVARKTDLIFPEPVPERGVPAGAVVLVGAVVAAFAYIGWYQWSGSGTRTVDAVPPVPPRLEQAAREVTPPPAPVPPAPTVVVPTVPSQTATLPAGTAPRPAVTGPQPAPVPAPPGPAATPRPSGPGTPPAPPSGPVAAAPPQGPATAATQPPRPPATPGSPAPAPTATPPAGAPVVATPVPATAAGAAPRPAAIEDGRVLLRARAEVWVQIRDPRSGVLVNRVLRPGETYAVPAREGLLLSTGNAGGLDVVVDGQVTSGLGAAQGVRRDIPLEPDRLKAALAAPPASPPTAAPAAAPAPGPAPAPPSGPAPARPAQ